MTLHEHTNQYHYHMQTLEQRLRLLCIQSIILHQLIMKDGGSTSVADVAKNYTVNCKLFVGLAFNFRFYRITPSFVYHFYQVN